MRQASQHNVDPRRREKKPMQQDFARLSDLLSSIKSSILLLEQKRDQIQLEVERKEKVIKRMRRARVAEPLAEDEDEADLADVPPAARLIVPADVLDLSDLETTEIEWCGTSGLKLTVLAGLEQLTKLQVVSFRSGFIRKPSGLAHLSATLRVLELYENRLRTLEGVQGLANLETLDISYNRLGRLEPEFLAPVGAHLTRLYVAENKLLEISADAMRPMVNLRLLDLGGNNLRKIQGLETLVNLEELWLGKNKITKLEGFQALTKLKRLSVQSNRIRRIENLECLLALEELYLSDQGIDEIRGLDTLKNLSTLDLTNNQLTSTSGLPELPLLTDLWLAANKIASYEDVDRLQPLLPAIDTLHFERNPIADDFEYRKHLKAAFPTLHYIDATVCR
jgi:protein phosphatase 1 regulatory subunit 7